MRPRRCHICSRPPGDTDDPVQREICGCSDPASHSEGSDQPEHSEIEAKPSGSFGRSGDEFDGAQRCAFPDTF